MSEEPAACRGLRRSDVVWSAVRNWGQRFGTILTFLVLARILDPVAIGLFATAAAVIAFLDLFADNGLGDAVVQSGSVDRGAVMGAFLLNLAIALALYVAICAGAETIAAILGADGMAPLLRVAGIALLFNALSCVAQALLRRDLQFRRLAMRALCAMALGAAVGIGMALAGFGVWSLAGQFLTTSFVNMALVWLPPVLPAARPDAAAAAGLVRFGVNVFLARLVNFGSNRGVELLIPFLFGPVAMGYYFLGSRIPFVMAQMTSAVMMDVSLPHLSRLRAERAGFDAAVYGAIGLSAEAAAPLFLMLAALAPEAAALAFGAKGAGAWPVMAAIAVMASVQALGYFNEVALSALGHSGVVFRNAVVTLVLVAGSYAALSGLTAVWLVCGYAATQIVCVFIAVIISRRRSGLELSRVLRAWAPGYGAGLLALLAVQALRFLPGFGDWHLLLRSGAGGLLFLAVFLASLTVLDRTAYKRLRELLGRGRKGRPGRA